MATIAEVMLNLPKIFKPEKAKGWNRVILFDLDGEEPSKWTLTIEHGQAVIEAGNSKTPKLTVNGHSEHVIQMFTGEVPPMKLVNAKLVRMKGPLMDSMAFSGLWNIPKK
ncbi:MAG: SCP2 sterol-binding domain-containing protein [Chloroflexales bacterium]|nr:SCP2 sterol-binding domain-containing protein [Chloroflexales bacterium]